MNIYKKIVFLLFSGCLLLMMPGGTLMAQQANLNTVIQQARESGIDKAALTALRQRAKSRGISDQQLVELIQPAIDMARENLPGNLAIDKAMEGLSKGISASRIGPVLQQLKQTTAEAVKIVDPWLDKPAVNEMISNSSSGLTKSKFRNELTRVTAKALGQNVSSAMAREIFNEIGRPDVLGKTAPPDIIAAIGILPDMPQGAGNVQTGKFISRALKGGFKANELQNLPSAVNMAQQRGQLPAASVIEGVSKQLKGGVPAKQILQNLFNGEIGGGPPGNVPKGLNNNAGKGNQGNRGGNN